MLPETEIQCINSYIVHKMLYTQYYPGSTLNTFVNVICVKVLLNFSALQVQKGRERGKKCLWNPKQDYFFLHFEFQPAHSAVQEKLTEHKPTQL